VSGRYLSAAGIVVVLVLARAYLSTGGSTPAGQPPLADLTSLETLKREFNRDLSKIRVIVSLAPSCPYCLSGATEIERVLSQHADHALAIFVVWQPILATDWGKPGTGGLRRLSDVRVRQFWDADHHVAKALRQSLEGRDREPDCCDHNGVWWDFMAAFPPGGEWRDAFPEPLLLNGTVEDAAPLCEALLGK